MFTGLIREIATVKSYTNNILTIQAKHKAGLGDSIAINGICLTVVKIIPIENCLSEPFQSGYMMIRSKPVTGEFPGPFSKPIPLLATRSVLPAWMSAVSLR